MPYPRCHNKLFALLLVFGILTQSSASALALTQQEPTSPQSSVLIPDGTEFTVYTTEDLSSKTATEGDPVNFKVDEDVVIDGRTVIAKGTLVKGVVSSTVRSGRAGKGGKLGIRVESTQTVDRQKLLLRAAKGKGGGDKTASVIALTLFLSPFFLLKKGKDAKIKAGTKIQVFTDEEKTVNVQASAASALPLSSQPAAAIVTETVIKQEPSAKAHYQRGLDLVKQQRWAEAENAFREAVRLNPNNPYYHFQLGSSLSPQMRTAETEAEFREAARLDPSNALWHAKLGYVLSVQKKWEEAEREASEAVRLDVTNAGYKTLLQNIQQKK